MSIKLTADQWELYSASIACGNAARSLNAIANRALKNICKDAPKLGMERSFRTHLEAAETEFKKFRTFGAWDTEPRGHLRHELRKALLLPEGY